MGSGARALGNHPALLPVWCLREHIPGPRAGRSSGDGSQSPGPGEKGWLQGSELCCHTWHLDLAPFVSWLDKSQRDWPWPFMFAV